MTLNQCPRCGAYGMLIDTEEGLACDECGELVLDALVAAAAASRNGHGPAHAVQAPPQPLTTRPLVLDKLRPVEWLWSGRLVRGVLNLLTGEEGVGKGTLLAWLIARVTRGELPGELEGTPSRVLWIGDEDSWEQVVGPRLYVAGADLPLVQQLTMADESTLLDVARDAASLDALLARERFQLVAFEALVDNLPRLRNPTDMVEVRNALRPLRRVLAKHEATGLGTLHTTKVETSEFRRKQGGSHQFNALSRSSLFVGQNPDGSGLRGLMRAKGNYGSPPPAITFAINGQEFELNGYGFNEPLAVAFSEQPELSLEELVRGPRVQAGVPEAPKRDALREPLLALLCDEPQATRVLAELVGATYSTTREALLELKTDGLAESTSRGWLVGPPYRSDQPIKQDGQVVQLPLDDHEDSEETT
jgi:energy-coupling factor transporter ATP-binding protein EcfA2